jgi:hypothetical protein
LVLSGSVGGGPTTATIAAVGSSAGGSMVKRWRTIVFVGLNWTSDMFNYCTVQLDYNCRGAALNICMLLSFEVEAFYSSRKWIPFHHMYYYFLFVGEETTNQTGKSIARLDQQETT